MAYQKDPAEKKPYAIDWTGPLAGDTIATSTWAHAPAGLTLSLQSKTNTVATVWVAGGTVGVEYRVSNHVVTAAGMELERSFTITVVDL